MKEALKKDVYNASKGVLGKESARQYANGYADGCVEGICVTAEELINAFQEFSVIPASVVVENLENMLKKYEQHRIKWEVKK